jgi:hypothetical protein
LICKAHSEVNPFLIFVLLCLFPAKRAYPDAEP